jgi:hypothetical protein
LFDVPLLMTDSLDRRSFIKLTAITGTSAAIAGCAVPQEALIRFVPDEDFVPGIASGSRASAPAVPPAAACSRA